MGRRKHDFYPTSDWMTEQLLARVPQISGQVLEPCTGNDDMTRVLRKHSGIELVTTNDIDPIRTADFHLDARTPEIYTVKEFDWIVTNPPFSDGIKIVQLAYEHSKKGCAMLLRLTFLEPTNDRGPWLAEHPPTYQLTLPRYSFTGDGNTDSVTTAWFVWEKGVTAQTNIVVPRPTKASEVLSEKK